MTAAQKVQNAGSLTVQEVSRLSGLSEPALCYKKIVLVAPVDRDESSGHRRYSAAVVDRISTR